MNKFKVLFISLSMVIAVLVASYCGVSAASTTVAGDINCDNKLTSADYNLLEKYLAGYDTTKISTFDTTKLDYNGDGAIDLQDLLAIGYYASDMGMYSPNY